MLIKYGKISKFERNKSKKKKKEILDSVLSLYTFKMPGKKCEKD